MKKSLYHYCLEQERPDLLAQWHPTLNEMLAPEQVTYGSKKKVWWRCERGHEWQSVVYTRTSGKKGCPYCANQKINHGENDLLTQNPKLVESWNFEKNKDVTPNQVSAGSNRCVWWKCDQGHEWRASVKSRSQGKGCPHCAGRVVVAGENDLATTHPNLVLQWHPTKNGNIAPQTIMAGTARKVWWVCERGHEWKATVASRAGAGTSCPVCAGKVVVSGENDLSSMFPNLAAEWHPMKNKPLTPQQVTPFSNRKVWWICPLGHEYFSIIDGRTQNGNGCPYCSGKKVLKGFNDLATLEPEVAKQWHTELNGSFSPAQVTTGSHKKVWWQCVEGHVWKAIVYSRARRKTGCPVCAGKVKESQRESYRFIMTDL